MNAALAAIRAFHASCIACGEVVHDEESMRQHACRRCYHVGLAQLEEHLRTCRRNEAFADEAAVSA